MDEKLYCHVCKEFKETSQFSPCKKAKLRNGKSYDGRTNTNVSIDRIDSSKGYTKDNIWLICSAVNFMKSNLNLEEFKQYCQAVINYKK